MNTSLPAMRAMKEERNGYVAWGTPFSSTPAPGIPLADSITNRGTRVKIARPHTFRNEIGNFGYP
ncbi:MAG: hypothetical protein D6795_03775 [Deltaproteobacteria bacterium]|nr:MAG: hypothetical protein D6795_03775 [Deltaproteobacteria bacterium]